MKIFDNLNHYNFEDLINQFIIRLFSNYYISRKVFFELLFNL
jgi:hypothetical protein